VKNTSLFRHGPTSSPNGRAAESVEKNIKLFYARLSGITKNRQAQRTLTIMKREHSNKLRELNKRKYKRKYNKFIQEKKYIKKNIK